jgi:hypothetical protein
VSEKLSEKRVVADEEAMIVKTHAKARTFLTFFMEFVLCWG